MTAAALAVGTTKNRFIPAPSRELGRLPAAPDTARENV
jgi:hypothetical protein